jgi:hypothetical protein
MNIEKIAKNSYWGVLVNPVYAAPTDPLSGLGNNICDILDRIISWAFGIVVLVAAIFLIIGGLGYMQSGGDKMAVEKARGRITSALVGLLVGIAAWLIVRVIMTVVTAGIPGCKSQI